MYVILLKQVHFCFHATSSYEGAYHNDFEYGCNTVVVLWPKVLPSVDPSRSNFGKSCCRSPKVLLAESA